MTRPCPETLQPCNRPECRMRDLCAVNVTRQRERVLLGAQWSAPAPEQAQGLRFNQRRFWLVLGGIVLAFAVWAARQ